jgi:hypothetical protein
LHVSGWTYYAPLWLGTLITAAVMALGWNGLWERPGWQSALWLLGVAPAVGLICQIEMLGAQGAFAQVLPVPGGRSVRGSGAVLSGALVLAAVNAGIVCAMFVFEGARTQATWTAIFSGAALLAAFAAYAWSLPAAARDFADDQRAG